MLKSLTTVEKGMIDKLRAKLAELGYPLPIDTESEAILIAALRYKDVRGELMKFLEELEEN